mgnify:CR=1 FL=1
MVAGGIVLFHKSIGLDKRLVYIFVFYIVLRSFLNDMHAGHRVLMLFKPFLIIFVVHLISSLVKKLKVKPPFIAWTAVAFVFMMYGMFNMMVRLSDDPHFFNLKFNLDFINSHGTYIIEVCCEG